MNNKDNGGPAYPVDSKCTERKNDQHGNVMYEAFSVPSPGMTLLDYFAGQALSALKRFYSDEYAHDQVAKWSYDMAKAMVAEKRKREADED